MNLSANEHQVALGHQTVVEKLWTEPLLAACDLVGSIPHDASVLVAESRCGLVPRTIATELSDARVMALDPSRAMLDVARSRIDSELQSRVFFVPERVTGLSYADEVFGSSICFHGVVTMRQLKESLSELARVTARGGNVVLAVPLADSFPQFYDILDEALRAHQLHDVLGRMYELRESFVTSSRLFDVATELNLVDAKIEAVSWSVVFETGSELLLSPFVRETFFPHWIGVIRSSDREPILRYIADAIDTYWHEREFKCDVVAGCLTAIR